MMAIRFVFFISIVFREAINCSPTNLFISYFSSVGTNPLLVFFFGGRSDYLLKVDCKFFLDASRKRNLF